MSGGAWNWRKHVHTLPAQKMQASTPTGSAYSQGQAPGQAAARPACLPTPAQLPRLAPSVCRSICLWNGLCLFADFRLYFLISFFSFLDTSLGYLSLLDADYDRTPPNQYFAEAVNYTVHFQWLQCLFGDKREWRSGSFSPQPGSSPETVNCRYTCYILLSAGTSL